MADIVDLTIAQLRDGLAQRKFSAADVARAYVAAVEKNRHLNAFVVETPEIALANFQSVFGKPDIVKVDKDDTRGSWVLLKLDPRLPAERRASILQRLEASFQPTPDQIGDFLFLDMRDRVKLLGQDFRGAIFYFSAFKGKVAGQNTELLDMTRANTVLNLVVP